MPPTILVNASFSVRYGCGVATLGNACFNAFFDGGGHHVEVVDQD